MRVAAVVAEYNPMHTGHIYHLEKTGEISGADFVMAIMSGNFTQRGEAAIYDKWMRARIAVSSGVDLVLELPFVFACNSAEYFASGAISILKGLGCVDILSFGSESGNIEDLERLGAFLSEEPRDYRDILQENLNTGLSFPAARERAVSHVLGKGAGKVLSSPNNILAVEYIKAARRQGFEVERMTVKRKGNYHCRDIGGEMASATAIRQKISEGKAQEIMTYLPLEGKELLKKTRIKVANSEMFYSLIRSAILVQPSEQISKIFGISEGMENRIKREIRRHDTLSTFVDALVSKRYTRVGIQRLLVHILMNFQKQNLFAYRPYGRVLALNDKGGRILRLVKEKGELEVISNINKSPRPSLMKYDILASDVYNLALERDLYEHSDYVMDPFVS